MSLKCFMYLTWNQYMISLNFFTFVVKSQSLAICICRCFNAKCVDVLNIPCIAIHIFFMQHSIFLNSTELICFQCSICSPIYLILFIFVLVVMLSFETKYRKSGSPPAILCQLESWYVICYISTKKWSDCHETKNKHINWTQGLKCDHQVWPWPWHWPWMFKVKYRICYISAKIVQLPRIEKQIYRLNFRPQRWPSDLTLDMTLTLNCRGQIWNLLYLNLNVVRLPRNEKQTYQLDSTPQMWPMGLTLTILFFNVKCDLDLWPHTWPFHGQFFLK